MKVIHSLVARLRGKNSDLTPPAVILEQMGEARPLPLGMTDFDVWSDRIIAGACLSASRRSQKFALAEMIMHIKPTEDHCSDGYFIKCLRKSAANQIAYAKMEEFRALIKAEGEAEKAKTEAEALAKSVAQPIDAAMSGAAELQ